LTRSVHFWRDFAMHRSLIGVHEAAYVALQGILQQSFFGVASTGDDLSARGLEGRRKTAAAIREYWAKVKGLPKEERWFRTLADDTADLDRWLQAAASIVQPVDVEVTPGSMFGTGWVSVPARAPGTRPRLSGEALRTLKSPSVSELLLRRVAQLKSDESRGPDAALSLMLALADWDGKARLPELTEFTHQLEKSAGPDRLRADDRRVYRLIRLYSRRAELGDESALDEYAAFVRRVGPGSFGSEAKELLALLWQHADRPAMAAAAEWMFSSPDSPWTQAGTQEGSPYYSTYELWTSPLLGVPAFRKLLLQMLGDTSDRGEVKWTTRGDFELTVKNGWSGGYSGAAARDEVKAAPGTVFRFRTGELIAAQLATLEGFPRCELYWPLARRQRAVEASKSFLQQYGGRWSYQPAVSRNVWGEDSARMHFAPLAAPATPAQVQAGEAIFSFAGETGKASVALLPAFPLKARWVANKRHPYDQQGVRDGQQFSERRYYQDGWIWQAEDLEVNGKTQRYYGFVGRFETARVPAEELECVADEGQGWRELSGGLDVRLAAPGQSWVETSSSFTALSPEDPQWVHLSLRNRKAIAQEMPVELRDGITVHLAQHIGETPPSPWDEKQWRELARRPAAPYSGGARGQSRAPGETWNALSLDLHDFFELKAAGTYLVWISFEPASGIGGGSTERVVFSLVAARQKP
jgi:hypothetical protein